MNNKLLIPVLFFALLFSSCRKDDVTIDPGTEPYPPTTQVESSFFGITYDRNTDLVLEGATVITEVGNFATDEFGYFQVKEEALSKSGSLIKVQMDGYFDAFKFVMPSPGNNTFVSIEMVPKLDFLSMNSNESKTIFYDGTNSKLTIKANSVAHANGDPYNGNFQVFTHLYDPNKMDFISTSPGDFRGLDLNQNLVQLESYGMIAVEMVSPNGEKLNLIEGQTATWEVAIPMNIATLVDQIPLWSLDEDSGVWKEEGVAQLMDDVYIAELPHFSFWNCDVPYELIELSGQVKDDNGNPLSYVEVVVSRVGGSESGYTYTDSNGFFRGKVPKGVPLELSVHQECLNYFVSQIGPFTEDEDLGMINTVQVNSSNQEYYGKFKDCDGNPISNGYVTISRNRKIIDVVQTNTDGSFSGSFQTCALSEISVQGVDLTGMTESEIIDFTVEIGDPILNIGSLESCDALGDDYWLINTDQGEVVLYTDIFAVFSGTNYIEIFVNSSGGLVNQIALFDPMVGDNQPSVVTVDYPGSSSAFCSAAACDRTNVTLLGVPKFDGDVIQGTLTGEMQFMDGSTKVIDIQFRTTMENGPTSSAGSSTISGSMWLDENGNGIREPNEPPVTDVGIFATNASTTIMANVSADGEYSMTLDKNTTIDLILQILPKYEISPQDQGNDDSIDSDFNSVAQIGNLTITEDEYIFDAGFIPTNFIEVNVSTVDIYCNNGEGCVGIQFPDISSALYDLTLSTPIGAPIEFFDLIGDQQLCDGIVAGDYLLQMYMNGVVVYEEYISIKMSDFELMVIDSFSHCENDLPVYNSVVYVNGSFAGYPFSVKWYDENMTTILETGPYLEHGGGQYNVVVEVNGCEASSMTDLVPDTNIFIRGKVWDDSTGSIPNEGEPDELGINDVEIRLYDSASGDLISTSMTFSRGDISMSNHLNGGEPFYLEIVVPAGYELVEQGISTPNTVSSDANPMTGRTEDFDPEKCGFYEFNFGLKK